MSDLGRLMTEERNSRSSEIDMMPTVEMLRLINDEDAGVARAVAAEIPQIAQVVDAVVERFAHGGRLFYIGAGTSGRLGVLDASECPPTFSVPRDLVVGMIAGGDAALRTSAEKAEDSAEQGAVDLEGAGFGRVSVYDARCVDTLVGIAASGRTPYVLGAVRFAQMKGALTVGLSCVPNSKLASEAEIAITPATGPEVVTGSTRLKAGTATKLVLNMISTGVMVRRGLVYGNLMVNVQPTNEKLVDRAARIVAAATQSSDQEARSLLQEAGNVKTAIVMSQLGIHAAEAEALLSDTKGNLRKALGK